VVSVLVGLLIHWVCCYRYWNEFKWPIKERQRKVDYISSAGMWLMELADQFSFVKSESE
jgi:hypothetical protein